MLAKPVPPTSHNPRRIPKSPNQHQTTENISKAPSPPDNEAKDATLWGFLRKWMLIFWVLWEVKFTPILRGSQWVEPELTSLWGAGGATRPRGLWHGVSPGKAAVMQICGETDHCHVMHIFHSGIPQSLRFLLEDPTLLKVGVGIANDAVKVFKDHNVSIKSLEDLSCLANRKLAGGPQKWGLESLTRKLISKELHKPKEIRLGNWEKFFLSKEQLDYAATDAFASWYLYKVLEGLPDPEVAACQGSETLEGVTSE
uniref:3'-5' exonuclease n=1 Tax=Fagus sylvatica TaxID=28930 RepID=A0A2N9EHG0_FAGSY